MTISLCLETNRNPAVVGGEDLIRAFVRQWVNAQDQSIAAWRLSSKA